MRLNLLSLALCLAALTPTLPASTLQISTSGTFSSLALETSLTAPGATYSLSFDFASNPAVTDADAYNFRLASFSNFHYSLNGQPLTGPVEYIAFQKGLYNSLDICLSGACDQALPPLQFLDFTFGSQPLFSGSGFDPVLQPGSYNLNVLDYDTLDNVGGALPIDSPFVITDVSTTATPEPTTLTLLTTGLVGLGTTLRHRRRP